MVELYLSHLSSLESFLHLSSPVVMIFIDILEMRRNLHSLGIVHANIRMRGDLPLLSLGLGCYQLLLLDLLVQPLLLLELVDPSAVSLGY